MTRRNVCSTTGFQMLSGKAQKQIIKCEGTVIVLMIFIALISITWSISLHILSTDFYNGIIGAKLAFRERDFQLLNDHERNILYEDVGRLVNKRYTANNTALQLTTALSPHIATASFSNDNNSTTAIEVTTALPANVDTATENTSANSQTTKPPVVTKIKHLIQWRRNKDEPDSEENIGKSKNRSDLAKVKFDMESDRKFLSRMTINIHQTNWQRNVAVQFVYSFPLLSEIIAIIWAAMCMVYQSGVTKYWGIPKPWRIVVPSILIFSLMFIGNLAYTILANSYIKSFCANISANLTDPLRLSCGEAMSVLRPVIRHHEFQHDAYLYLFKISYIVSLILWFLALLVMLLRYILAIDFQLVDVRTHFDVHSSPTFTEVLLQPPQQSPVKLLPLTERRVTEDDFQSAKSHISEISTPLLDHTRTAKVS